MINLEHLLSSQRQPASRSGSLDNLPITLKDSQEVSKPSKAAWRKFQHLSDTAHRRIEEHKKEHEELERLLQQINESPFPEEQLPLYLSLAEKYAPLDSADEMSYVTKREYFALGLCYIYEGQPEKGQEIIYKMAELEIPMAWIYVKLHPEKFPQCPPRPQGFYMKEVMDKVEEGDLEGALKIPFAASNQAALEARYIIAEKLDNKEVMNETAYALVDLNKPPHTNPLDQYFLSFSSKMLAVALAQKLEPSQNSPFSLFMRKIEEGMRLFENRSYQEAVLAFEEAIDLMETYEIPAELSYHHYNILAQAYYQIGNLEASAKCLVENCNGGTPFFHSLQRVAAFYLGGDENLELLRQGNRIDQILSALLMKAAGLNPSFVASDEEIFMSSPEKDFRRGDYEKIISSPIFPHHFSYYKAPSLALMGQYEEALKIYSDEITQMPENSNLFIERGMVHFLMGNQEEALKDLRAAETIEKQWFSRREGEVVFIPRATFLIDWVKLNS